MSDKIERYEAEAREFADELDDEALDRSAGVTRACCAFCGGGGSGWVQPAPLREKA
jgi:hypothetical protein